MTIGIQLRTWALRHHVGEDALRDLSALLGMAAPVNPAGGSEARVQSEIRLAAPAKGYRLFRNNVGALLDARGVPVRFGLANDSKALNERYKSGDLIGWRRLVITPQMVGSTVAQFTSLECKEASWTYRGDAHEVAQARWAALVASEGGYATFANGTGALA